MCAIAPDSGAGAYSNFGMSVQSVQSVQREVVGAGVAAGSQLGPLHEQVVQQAGGAEAEPVRVEPVLPRRLVDQDQVAYGVLGGADAAGRLDADLAAAGVPEVPHGLQHDQGNRERGGRADLAGRGLDEVGAGQHGQPRGTSHVVQRDQLAGFQDDLEVSSAGGAGGRFDDLADGGDLVIHQLVVPGQEGAAVDDHVHLVGARLDRVPGVGQLDLHAGPAAGERGGHAGHVDAGPLDLGRREVSEVWVDADRGDLRCGRVGGIGAFGLGADGPHLARRVLALQRGQVDHRDGHVERPLLGRGLDRPAGEHGRPGLRPDLVHAGQPVQELPQRGARSGPDVNWRAHRRLPPATILTYGRDHEVCHPTSPRGPAVPPYRPDPVLGRPRRRKLIARIANHRSGSRVLVTVRHWLLRRCIDYSRAKPWLGRAMDQGFPDGALPDDNRPGGPPTELQRRVAEGAEPRTILEELWQTMQARLYGYGCKRLPDTSQAEDFVQKVFLKMQVNFARMIAREPVEAWIFTVARNEIVDSYRERAKSDVPAEAALLDRDSAEESWRIPFEEQIETRIGDIRPLYAYLRAILARGWLRDDDLRAYWQGIVEEVPQRALARQLGVTQGRISQLK